jgi:hypothetical protein
MFLPAGSSAPGWGASTGPKRPLGSCDGRDNNRDAVALAAILPGPPCELGFTANRDGVTPTEPEQLLGEWAEGDERGNNRLLPGNTPDAGGRETAFLTVAGLRVGG